MKYICTETPSGYAEIFVFPRMVDHDMMMEAIKMIRTDGVRGWLRIERNPVSAGYVDEAGQCHGKSETLKLESRPKIDSSLLRMQMRDEKVFAGYEQTIKEPT